MNRIDFIRFGQALKLTVSGLGRHQNRRDPVWADTQTNFIRFGQTPKPALSGVGRFQNQLYPVWADIKTDSIRFGQTSKPTLSGLGGHQNRIYPVWADIKTDSIWFGRTSEPVWADIETDFIKFEQTPKPTLSVCPCQLVALKPALSGLGRHRNRLYPAWAGTQTDLICLPKPTLSGLATSVGGLCSAVNLIGQNYPGEVRNAQLSASGYFRPLFSC